MEAELLTVFYLQKLNGFLKLKTVKNVINKFGYTDLEELTNFIEVSIYFLNIDYSNYHNQYLDIAKKDRQVLEEVEVYSKLQKAIKPASLIDFTMYLFLSYKLLLIFYLKRQNDSYKKEYLKTLKKLLKFIILEFSTKKNNDLETDIVFNEINQHIDNYITIVLN